jgi:hypothetical protein
MLIVSNKYSIEYDIPGIDKFSENLGATLKFYAPRG